MAETWWCPCCSKQRVPYGASCPLATKDAPTGWLACDQELNVNGVMYRRLLREGIEASKNAGLGLSEIANKEE